MNIAIASGKGGTGKTTVAVNLARALFHSGNKVCYADCDVEEPNGHIFLKPAITETCTVGIPVPHVQQDKCTLCRECANICAYSAIIQIADKILTFPEMCHGCGGCMLVCPENAITEESREIGIIEIGESYGIQFIHGKLNVGITISPPLIHRVISLLNPAIVNIIDAPPGTSCPVIQSIKKADYLILVSEPTPFGLSDLKLAIELVKELHLPYGIVINRSDVGTNEMIEYCNENNIEILLSIPHDRKIAETYSFGKIIYDELPEYRKLFELLGVTVTDRLKTHSKLQKARYSV